MVYRTTLIDSREGVNLTVQEAKQMAAIIAPLLKQGLVWAMAAFVEPLVMPTRMIRRSSKVK